jgi:hypothetical protein
MKKERNPVVVLLFLQMVGDLRMSRLKFVTQSYEGSLEGRAGTKNADVI